MAELQTRTTTISSRAPEVSILVTHVRAPDPRGAAVLTHGAGSPSSAIWDLPGSYSMLRRLACAGLDAFAVDVRGFGGSTKPPPGPDGHPGPVRARDVMPDLGAAMDFARDRSGRDQVDLVGWSWGCVVAGMYAGLEPETVRRLVLFAPVYDRRWPRRHATKAEWAPVERAEIFRYFAPEREERSVLEAYAKALFRHADTDGRVLLSNGPYFDIYGEDAPIWAADRVRAPTLVLQGDADLASKPQAGLRLFGDLTGTRARRYVVLGGAGHFAFRTRAHRAWQHAVVDFLVAPEETLGGPAAPP